MRLAQVECEALSHRFPREKPKGIFLGFQCLGYYLGFSSFCRLFFVVDNKLFCITTSIITRVILLPQRREYGVVFATQRQIYIHIYI